MTRMLTITYDKSDEDIPVMCIAENNLFSISVIKILTGERAEQLYKELTEHNEVVKTEMTNGEILETFGKKYPKLRVKDYRPLCPELFTHDLKGITIWLENGDVIQYYPKEAQAESGDKQ